MNEPEIDLLSKQDRFKKRIVSSLWLTLKAYGAIFILGLIVGTIVYADVYDSWIINYSYLLTGCLYECHSVPFIPLVVILSFIFIISFLLYNTGIFYKIRSSYLFFIPFIISLILIGSFAIFIIAAVEEYKHIKSGKESLHITISYYCDYSSDECKNVDKYLKVNKKIINKKINLYELRYFEMVDNYKKHCGNEINYDPGVFISYYNSPCIIGEEDAIAFFEEVKKGKIPYAN